MTVIPLTFTTGNHTPPNFILTGVKKRLIEPERLR